MFLNVEVYSSPRMFAGRHLFIVATRFQTLKFTHGHVCLQAGTYSLGSTNVCTTCATGTYSTAVGANSVLTCQKCAPGSYADEPGSTVCKGCGPGNYGTLQGATTYISGCMPCPKGTFSSLAVSDTCSPCGAGR